MSISRTLASLASSVNASGDVVIETTKTLSNNYTMTSTNNGVTVGPVSVASGVTMTIPSGNRLVVL